MDLAEGDEIVFSKYGGTEIRLGNDDYLILRSRTCSRRSSAAPAKVEEEAAGRRGRVKRTNGGN